LSELSLSEKIQQAWNRRSALHADPSHTAYRIFSGHSEGLPGFNIERFADTAVLYCHRPVSSDELDIAASALERCFAPTRIILKEKVQGGPSSPDACGRVLRGETLEGPLEVLEHGLRFLVDPLLTPNVGLFLDARPARAWLMENSRDRRVLNLFAYTGSLGVAAAAGGARSVIHLDTQARSLQRAQENHALNGIPIDERALVRGNVYRHLPRAQRSGQQFDGIILDPPPQVPERGGRRKPVGQDVGTLSKLCSPLLAPDAWILCFFHGRTGSRQERENEVLSCASRPLSVIWRGQSGEDFYEVNAQDKLQMTVFQLEGKQEQSR
jgi:23S rRNA (cytosine1962-C5)-methyltransferase